MKPAVFSSAAREEFAEAYDFYEARQIGLGDRFESAVENAIERIRQNPGTGIPSEKNTRKYLVKKFPFGIVFREYETYILIIAIGHFSRRETYWIDRISEDDES